MLTISVQSDLKQLAGKIGVMGSRQMPFSIAKALTKTAQDTQRKITDDLPRDLSKPTAFTRRAFTIKAAQKDTLTAWVFAKDLQARYLAAQVQGSERRVKGFERKAEALAGEAPRYLVPTRNIKLDSSGNVSLAQIKRIAGAKDSKRFFIGTPKGGNRPFGIYMRHNRDKRLTALMVEADVGRYRRRIDLEGAARKVATTKFMAYLEQAFTQAMATAR